MANHRVDVKVVLLGREFGGKTSLVTRFLHDRFDDLPYRNTIGAAFGAKRMFVRGQPLVLGVWDTAGSERYEAMSRIYYRGAKAAVMCYDLTDRTSFDRVQFWVSELQNNEENCRVYLCGTKYDLIEADKTTRDVDYHTTTDYADTINADVFETSSKTGYNITELFQKIAHDFEESERLNNAQLDHQLNDKKSTVDLKAKLSKSKCCNQP